MAQLPDGDVAPLDGALPASVLANSSNKTLHAYLHIPFCRVRCGYCDFNTYTSSELRDVTQNSFLDDLLAEIRFSRQVFSNAGLPQREFSTVFFGGGTPSLLPPADLGRVISGIRNRFDLAADAEITLEANPDSVTAEKLAEYLAVGFNRISFGMQSAKPHVLAALDRTHNPENVAKAVSMARAAGFKSISVDLIYGTPGESLDD